MDAIAIAVPQADDLEKIFETLDLVGAGTTAAADIAEAMDVVHRQGHYYTAAAELLGLLQRDADGLWSLTGIGRMYHGASADKLAQRRNVVFKSEIVRFLLAGLEVKTPDYDKHHHLLEDVLYVTDRIEDAGYSHETASRRALTIKAWMKGLE